MSDSTSSTSPSSSSCCPPATSPQRRTTAKVQFYPAVAVFLVDRVTDKDACWFTQEEYQRMHAKNHKLIQKLETGESSGASAYCTRGLERMYGNRLATRLTRRSVLHKAVAVVQQQQHTQQDLAAVAAKVSQPACQEAYEMGLRDAQVVQAMIKKEEESSIPPSSNNTKNVVAAKTFLSSFRGMHIVVDRAPGVGASSSRGRI